jgi:hypothetical protein
MSKMAAIDVAVRMQLAADNRLIEYNRTMNTMRSPGAGHGDPPVNAPYNDATLRTFLLNVANLLRLDKPPRTFKWRGPETAECLAANLPTLLRMIESETDDLA